jgi:hypothetical protein
MPYGGRSSVVLNDEVIDDTWARERSIYLAHPPERRSVVCDCAWPLPRFHDTSAACRYLG